MRDMRTPFLLAKEVGSCLGGREILFRTMPEQ